MSAHDLALGSRRLDDMAPARHREPLTLLEYAVQGGGLEIGREPLDFRDAILVSGRHLGDDPVGSEVDGGRCGSGHGYVLVRCVPVRSPPRGRALDHFKSGRRASVQMR